MRPSKRASKRSRPQRISRNCPNADHDSPEDLVGAGLWVVAFLMLIISALDFMGEFGGSAFATILAVVAGLVWSASGAPSHTLWFNVKRQGATERERAAACVGVVAIVLGLLLGSGINVALIAGLALSIAASTDLSALALSPSRKPINIVGAVTGIGIGLSPPSS
ncbi:hypothetical protein P3H15_36890 [Rhodococcus sp. T2V]|uniref:hypothetical protein n=1 Tax=Rhodococcus sp. T2V TaxID=3034164 RepID=UPI0023E195EE|nr:hypothetical protein [Rhodococcus sp. T2V]MDF3310596.1 hypothetical protein [Rhodococcus sp. T2V]